MLIYPYSSTSTTAKKLAISLGCKRVSRNLPGNKPIETDTLINWGCSNFIRPVYCNIIYNKPASVANTSNKLRTFQILKEHEILIPEFTTNKDIAHSWIDSGHTVIARKTLHGKGGAGINIFAQETIIGEYPLYTKYVNTNYEFRIHTFKNRSPFLQQKLQRNGIQHSNNYGHIVRNHKNGYIFVNENSINFNKQNINLNKTKEQAQKALEVLQLDFCAFDIRTYLDGDSYFLEGNTAPGLVNSTLDTYTRVFSTENTYDYNPVY